MVLLIGPLVAIAGRAISGFDNWSNFGCRARHAGIRWVALASRPVQTGRRRRGWRRHISSVRTVVGVRNTVRWLLLWRLLLLMRRHVSLRGRPLRRELWRRSMVWARYNTVCLGRGRHAAADRSWSRWAGRTGRVGRASRTRAVCGWARWLLVRPQRLLPWASRSLGCMLRRRADAFSLIIGV